MTWEWDQADVYLSNNGRGPLKARILCVADGLVRLEMMSGKRRRQFQLPERFFLSPACGWRKERRS